MSDPMDDFDTGVDCGMPAAIVVAVWVLVIGCAGVFVIGAAILLTLTGGVR